MAVQPFMSKNAAQIGDILNPKQCNSHLPDLLFCSDREAADQHRSYGDTHKKLGNHVAVLRLVSMKLILYAMQIT
jgi:hypothetical protein